jgi:DNA-binding NtrC family response regulator
LKKICKVLIVEDDSDIRELLSGTFADQGYRFILAANAVEMRAALATDRDIDIVVVDLHLPGGIDGLVLAQEAAAQGLPVIMVSGDHSRVDEIANSGHRHILKPYRISSLLELVAETLEATKAECERRRDSATDRNLVL